MKIQRKNSLRNPEQTQSFKELLILLNYLLLGILMIKFNNHLITMKMIDNRIYFSK